MTPTYLWCFVISHALSIALGATPNNEEKCIKTTSLLNSSSSYFCRQVDSLAQIFNLVNEDTTELTIISSNLTNKDDMTDVLLDTLQILSLKKSFLGPQTLSWLYSLKRLKILQITECSTHELTNSRNVVIPALHLNASSLIHLESLAIKKCNISRLDAHNSSDFSTLHFTLTDNMFECKSGNFIWLLDLPSHSLSMKNATCFVEKEYNTMDSFPLIYTIAGISFRTIMTYRKEVLYNCPPKCHCMFTGYLQHKSRPMININCVGQNLTRLPSVIPKGSTGCNFSYNLIEDLTPYFKISTYKTIHYAVFAHNRIKYFDAALFLQFLKDRSDSDVGFNLKYNKLTKFPAAEIMKLKTESSKKSSLLPAFHLGHNPYICSCENIREFHAMIFRHMQFIADVTDIKCSQEDYYHPGEMIFSLDIESLCPSKTPFHPLDVINIILGILVMLLLASLIYNSHQYHKHRKLPWIVRRFNRK